MNSLNKQVQENEMQDSANQTVEISIFDLIYLVMKNWWVIVLIGGIMALAVYAYSKTTTIPTYKSTCSLYIDTQREQETGDVNTMALMGAQDLMPTYIQILKSRTFCTRVSDALENKYSYGEISSMIYFNQVEETNIMKIDVVCIDEQDSYRICDSVVDLAVEEILRVFEGGSVKIIDRPEEMPTVIAANSFRRGIIGFVLGAALAVAVLFVISMFDTRIESADELTTRYKLPILGEVPNLSDNS